MPSNKKNPNRSGKQPSDLGRTAKALKAALAGRRIDDVSHVELMAALARSYGTTLNVAVERTRQNETGITAEAASTPKPIAGHRPTTGQITLLNHYPNVEELDLPRDVELIDHEVRQGGGIGDTLFRFLWIEIGEVGDEGDDAHRALETAIADIRDVMHHLPDDTGNLGTIDRYDVIAAASESDYLAGRGTTLHTALPLKVQAYDHGWTAGKTHPFVLVTDGKRWSLAMEGGRATPWDRPRMPAAAAPASEPDADCEAGLHDWIDRTGKLPPHTKCGRCGEEYGHPN